MFNGHKYIAFETILIKEVRRFTRIWMQTLLPPAITIGLYYLIFGNLIGRRIGDMGGYDYIDFIVPGLIMMAVIQNAYSNVSSSFFSNKFQRCIEEILVSPVPNYIILLGFVAGGMARGLLVGIIVTIMSFVFTSLSIAHLGLTVLVVLLTAMVFSLAGFINALFANTFDDISIIPTFVLTPLIYLGGVFYSIELLPEAGQWVSALNPVLYMVNTFRYGILGTSDVNVYWALSMLVFFSALLFGVALYLLRRGTGLRH
ncbi:MAG TPA: ABC transporter permease [Pseudohongiella sp.]|nr:ABC transporter permease [Pseudohongiella sp.]MAO39458.1 ABC transporter permease [Pseudohongiella sp.]MAY56915.1 ABC transporter permease [Gammaproteobacteria bacterium]MBJ56392.1 ABC transporter permease [Gammaproteobacteria bacterium]HBX36500.1 ABC transporter permease [Pseudohongiella sp.]|tara:strand:- start:1115 stop:1888 length:774 start_codon:yes stop_codon:yes gene_type:complete